MSSLVTMINRRVPAPTVISSEPSTSLADIYVQCAMDSWLDRTSWLLNESRDCDNASSLDSRYKYTVHAPAAMSSTVYRPFVLSYSTNKNTHCYGDSPCYHQALMV